MLEVDRRKRARMQLFEADTETQTTASETTTQPPPSGFLCPLTMEVMFDPVLDAEGNTYERVALFEWLQHNRTSPVSRQPLNERMVIANNALRETIHEYMGKAWLEEQHNLHLQHQTPTKEASLLPQQSRLRAKIDCFLRNTCRELGGLDLKLNSEGCCAFRYDGITIVLDVPDKIGVFCLYTKDLVTTVDLKPDQLYRRALQLNFLQGDTRGGCLSVRKRSGGKEEEVMFSYTDRVPEVSAQDFSNILLNFVETSVVLRQKLLSHVEPNDKDDRECKGE